MCPLVGSLPPGITLPNVTMCFCAIDSWPAMKVLCTHATGSLVAFAQTLGTPQH